MRAVVWEGVLMGSSYEWKTPKTDWKTSYDDKGGYCGDYFEPDDYNRIKNNLYYLRDLADALYESQIALEDMGEDVYYGCEREFFATMLTRCQTNLDKINAGTRNIDLGETVSFYPNQPGYLVDELNRIEKMSLLLYRLLRGQADNKPRLSYRLGNRGGII